MSVASEPEWGFGSSSSTISMAELSEREIPPCCKWCAAKACAHCFACGKPICGGASPQCGQSKLMFSIPDLFLVPPTNPEKAPQVAYANKQMQLIAANAVKSDIPSLSCCMEPNCVTKVATYTQRVMDQKRDALIADYMNGCA